ncbi:hypothetical protein [Chryseobacterium sp. JK1]|uniref:hypothetical protein n=1 Tax=Chryseobacterium sp. JK1 TaxID=874294 RepID=UPI003D68422F
MTNEEKLRVYAAYLPYGLQLQHKYKKAKHNGETVLRSWVKPLEHLDLGCLFPYRKDSFDWKPIIYPLDFLTKEIDHEGKAVVIFDEIRKETNAANFVNIERYLMSIEDGMAGHLPYWVVNTLIRHHFNVFNLPECEYINKATLTNK